MTEDRFERMSEITERTKAFLDAFISPEDFVQPICYEIFMEFYKKRSQKRIWLRPYLTASFYEFLANESYVKAMPAVTVAEIFNISTYQSNMVFDNKIGINPINISGMNQFIASYLSMGLANKVLFQADIRDNEKLALIKLLNECNEKIYKGQSLDLNSLVLDNTYAMLNDEDYFNKSYSLRCNLIAGASVEFCALSAAILANVNDTSITNSLYELACQWGGIMQIINDLADYFVNRGNYGRYFDVRADKLTLPLYLIIKEANPDDLDGFVSRIRQLDDTSLETFFNQFIFLDSPVVKRIFKVLEAKWSLCNHEINALGLPKEFAQGLFESAFLNTYSRRLFSNKLIKSL